MGNDPNNPYELNIHGFPSTKVITSNKKSSQNITYDGDWVPYIQNRIKMVETVQKNQNHKRMTIKEFLSTPQFLESNINRLEPEDPRVENKFKDPLPPYEAGEPEFNKKRTGARRSYDYVLNKKKRREWGFREKVLQGYPEYKPFFPYQSKYIVGIVTVGSGIFSGIPNVTNSQKSATEIYRSAEIGLSGIYENQTVPTGLCFIQDETGGLGIALGTDIRYVLHPLIHNQNYSNPYIIYDEMHAGSIVIPKADYRQFLRIGDLVVIEVGTNFKYWHAILGSQPKNWETLWVPENMKIQKRNIGKKSSEAQYYIPDFICNGTFGKSISVDRGRVENTRPYVNNWGAHENYHQNSEFIYKFDTVQDVSPRGVFSDEIYSIYPIQDDHSWHHGTPIPVNTGMPYIMMEQFIVDETERISPVPLVITNSQLRGFPNPKHWSSKIKGFNSPKDLGIIDSSLAWKEETAEDPKKNPWISDPTISDDQRGSDFKGMLIQLKNVRFVLPPKKPQLRAKLAPSAEDLSPEIGPPSRVLYDTLPAREQLLLLLNNFYFRRNRTKFIFDVNIIFGYSGTGGQPQHNIETFLVASDIRYSIDSDLDFRVVDSMAIIRKEFEKIYNDRIYLDDFLVSHQRSVDTNPASPDELMKIAGQIMLDQWINISSIPELENDLKSMYSSLENGSEVSELQIFIGEQKFTGFTSIGEAELVLFYKHNIESRGFYFDYRIDPSDGKIVFLKEWTFSQKDEIVEAILEIAYTVIAPIVDSMTFPGFSGLTRYSIEYLIATNKKDTWDDSGYFDEDGRPKDGDRTSYIRYEFPVLESPFPKSVDRQDGGYWWANPDIPLTNARSHFKDNKETTNSTNLGIVTVGDTVRDVWSQHKSSTNVPEVKDRFVKDLGMMYSASYSPFAEEWKPSTIINGKLVMNEFEPIPTGSYFVGNRIYYVVDENNVVVPIRINSNTEIARHKIPIPNGNVNITGIAWQYSLGNHGLEWEREAYMMQVWPRFMSDISRLKLPDTPIVDERRPST